MKNLLLGWLIKGQYEISMLDTIIFFIEMFLLVLIISCILTGIDWLKEKIGGKR